MLRWNYSFNLNNLTKDVDKKAPYANRKAPFALKEVKIQEKYSRIE
jgi:hypothetical protein